MIGQYCEAVGHPGNQFLAIVNFLRNPDSVARLIEGLRYVRIPSEAEMRDINAQVERIVRAEVTKGTSSINGQPVAQYILNDLCPSLSRDSGVDILGIVASYHVRRNREYLPSQHSEESSREIIWVQVNLPFAHDSIFCEWCVVINLDNETLEIYRGRAWKDSNSSNRFNYLGEMGDGIPRLRYIIGFDEILVTTDDELFFDFFERDDQDLNWDDEDLSENQDPDWDGENLSKNVQFSAGADESIMRHHSGPTGNYQLIGKGERSAANQGWQLGGIGQYRAHTNQHHEDEQHFTKYFEQPRRENERLFASFQDQSN